jgi:predicted transcriptional regulator
MNTIAWPPRFTSYPVLDGGRPVGLLRVSSIAAVPRSAWERVRVRDVMIPADQLPRLSKDEKAVDALAALSGQSVHRGLVLETDI